MGNESGLKSSTFDRKNFKGLHGLGIGSLFAVKIITVIDTAASIAWIIHLSQSFSEHRNVSLKHQEAISMVKVFLGSYISKFVVTILLAVFLFQSVHAVTNTTAIKCKLWMFITAVIFNGYVIVVVYHLSTYPQREEIWFVIVLIIVSAVYRTCSFFVVWSYLKTLNCHCSKHEVCSVKLYDTDLDNFFNGDTQAFLLAASQMEKLQNAPYDKTLEVSLDYLCLDEENPLEQCETESLLKGTMFVPSRMPVLVEVKKTNEKMDSGYFNAVLKELKVMVYVSSVEKHKNIVNLLGAVTSHIAHRSLYTILEFCPYGNLQQFLITHRGLFLNFVKNSGDISADLAKEEYTNVQLFRLSSDLMSTYHLLAWCLGICRGLQYLSSIGIVHGGLCLSGIYLSENKTAKISAPTLPRQLYKYNTHEDKTKETPLPWRFMSIESLRDMLFTTNSDVWSLGVVFHEIFTLGAIPFAELSWTPDFVDYLIRGLRMKKPSFATNGIYKLMLECWDNDPTRRPALQYLCDFFEEELHEHGVLFDDMAED